MNFLKIALLTILLATTSCNANEVALDASDLGVRSDCSGLFRIILDKADVKSGHTLMDKLEAFKKNCSGEGLCKKKATVAAIEGVGGIWADFGDRLHLCEKNIDELIKHQR